MPSRLTKCWSLLWTPLGRRLVVASLALPWVVLVAVAAARARLEAPEPTLLVRDRQGRFLAELPPAGEERLGFWPVTELPARVVAATLAVEDRRFWRHPGVDPLALARAARQNLRAGARVSGASTIAMQVARLQRPGPRGYLRKAVEATTAMLLTLRYGREPLLAHYLAIVPYGNRIHGIGYAARRYLDKPVEDLSWAEVAFLSAIPQSPARRNPYDPLGRGRAIRRAREILDRLRAAGEMTALEHEIAARELDTLRLPWREVRPEPALHAVLALARRVPPDARRSRPLVRSTLDLELQSEIEELARRAVASAADRGAGNAAVLVVERAGFEVRAAVSSTGYFDAERAGAIDYLRLPRSSGSTLKPFLYARALELGQLSPATVIDDLGPGPGGIVNSDDRYLGPLLPRVALANSRNVPAVALLARLGLEPAYAFLGELGLHRFEQPAARFGLGLAIGSLPVTLDRLVTAYTALAGDGRRHELAWIEGEARPEPERVVGEATARQVTLFLADPQARLPTFPRMGFSEYPFAVAVKTGTSSRYRDAWTIAWSRDYLVGVWVGHPDERPMSQLSGYRVAARLTQGVLERLHRARLDGLEGVGFPPPRGHRLVALCALSGGRATAACDRVSAEWLDDSARPAPCGAHRRIALDRRTGAPATAATPAAVVEVRTLVDLPPRYAAWLERQSFAAWDPAFAAPEAPGAASLPGTPAAEPTVRIVSPEPGARLLRDPEAPPALNTLALAAVVEPPALQLVWYVDGRPFRTVEPPFAARWRLEPGEHWFEARVPYSPARSRAVRVRVD